VWIIGGLLGAIAILSLLIWKRHGATSDTTKKSANNSPLDQQILKSDFILNAMTDGVMVINAQQIIVTLNEEASAITGWPRNEAIGLDYRSVMQLTDGRGTAFQSNQDVIARTIREGASSRNDECSLLSRSKEIVSIGLSVSPLVNNQRQVTAAVVVFRNTSQQRKEQQQRSDFISTASHEMRTPVAAIEGYIDLALNDKVGKVDAKARDYLEKARLSSQGLGKLFQDLLTSSKVEDGRLVSHPVVVEMGDYLTKLVEDLRLVATKKKLKLDFTIGSGEVLNNTGAKPVATGLRVVRPLYYSKIDPDRMREVITNLFDNAVKYTEQGSITVGLTGDNKVVQFFITDTGPGIPAEDIPHLFQKFYRVDSSITRATNGTGLGLFISRKIVELYHGRIWVESQVNQGSTFYINLPRISSQTAAHRETTQPLIITPQTTTTPQVNS
jgi:PAS domain S-box-containing protein